MTESCILKSNNNNNGQIIENNNKSINGLDKSE